MKKAAADNADLVVFPEATLVAFGNDLPTAVTNDAEYWRTAVSKLATEYGITIMTGEFATPESEDDQGSEGSVDPRVRNVLGVYSPDGDRQEYAKIHLYDAFGFQESDSVQPGEQPLNVNIAGTTVGVAICYDIRFPKLFAELSRSGAQIVVLAASWGAGPGKVQQWQTLAHARALDSNTFVVALGQADPEVTGVDAISGPPTGVGYSLVADPFGGTVAELDGGEQLRVVDLDLSQVDQAKESIPVLKNARLGY